MRRLALLPLSLWYWPIATAVRHLRHNRRLLGGNGVPAEAAPSIISQILAVASDPQMLPADLMSCSALDGGGDPGAFQLFAEARIIKQ